MRKAWRYTLVVIAVLTLAALACGSSGSPSPSRPAATCTEQTFKGCGDDVVELPDTLRGCTKALLMHRGESNFIVVPNDANNNRLSSLVNEIGDYDGTVKWDQRAASLEVKADGAWTIAVQK